MVDLSIAGISQFHAADADSIFVALVGSDTELVRSSWMLHHGHNSLLWDNFGQKGEDEADFLVKSQD